MTKANHTRENTAFHEAGHAVVARHLGIRVRLVEIEGSRAEGTLGTCHARALTMRDVKRIVDDDVTANVRDRLEKAAMISLSGHAAVRKLGRKSYGCDQDFESVQAVLESVEGFQDDRVLRAYRRYLELKTETIVEVRWAWIANLAKALVAQPRIVGPAVIEAMDPSFAATYAELRKAFR